MWGEWTQTTIESAKDREVRVRKADKNWFATKLTLENIPRCNESIYQSVVARHTAQEHNHPHLRSSSHNVRSKNPAAFTVHRVALSSKKKNISTKCNTVVVLSAMRICDDNPREKWQYLSICAFFSCPDFFFASTKHTQFTHILHTTARAKHWWPVFSVDCVSRCKYAYAYEMKGRVTLFRGKDETLEQRKHECIEWVTPTAVLRNARIDWSRHLRRPCSALLRLGLECTVRTACRLTIPET